MTVAVTNASDGPFTGNGSTTVFPFTFRALTAAEVGVYVNGVLTAATVTLNGSGQGGSISFATAPAAGASVFPVSVPDFTQDMAITQNGAFLPDVIEQALDRAAARDIALKRDLGRAILAPMGQAGPSYSDFAATILGLLPSFTVTSAPGQAVSTRTLLAGIASPVSRQPALLTEAGREGEFIYLTGNLSAYVTADPLQGCYVAPNADATGASGAWVRKDWLQRPGYVLSAWFGQKSDGSTDDTAAVQASWDFIVARGGGAAELRAGVSIIGGALQDIARSNAQLLFPRVTAGASAVSLRICGPCPPTQQGGQISGAILKSTLSTGNGNVMGCKTSSSNGLSLVTLSLENFALVMPQNPTNSGIDLSYVQANTKRNLLVTVDAPITFSGGTAYVNATKPTTATSFGIKGPINDLCLWDNIDNVLVIGFYFGYFAGELIGGDNLCVSTCLWGVAFRESRHVVRFGRILILHCLNSIFIDGHCDLRQIMFDVEHDTSGGSGPSWIDRNPGAAAEIDRGWDLWDPADISRGDVHRHMHDSSIPWTQKGGTSLRFRDPGLPNDAGYSFGVIFNTFGTLVDANSLREIWSKNGKLPWISNIITQASTTGSLGARSYSNINGNSEIRLVQDAAGCDDSIQRGRYVLSTGRDGTLNTAWEVGSDLVQLIHNTLAAPASNPVGGGYLYVEAGALKYRGSSGTITVLGAA